MKRIVSLTVILSIALLALTSIAKASAPGMINYQGRLTDESGEPLNDTLSMIFAIYDDSTAGDSVWSELHNSVIVSEGLFTVLLGTTVPIDDSVFADTARWLQITVEGEDIEPRTRLVSAPYAFRAATVDGATGGIISGDVRIQSDLSVSGKATIGPGHTNTGSYAFVAGESNTASGQWATVGGGTDNVASGEEATVGGGHNNTADTNRATVGGGSNNTASGTNSTISGGGGNTVEGGSGTIGGGGGNTVSANYGTIAGGAVNLAGYRAFVGGGFMNTASGSWSAVGCGEHNLAGGSHATLGGGWYNTAGDSTDDLYPTVAGGRYNAAIGSGAFVGGGFGDTASAWASTVAGGHLNTATEQGATVGGGCENRASGRYAMIPGGVSNTVSGYCSFAAGRQVRITSDTDYTFAFGAFFSTSTPHAVVFYDSLSEIKVGIQDTAPTNILTVKQNSVTDPVADAWTIHSSKEYKRDIHELTPEEYRQALEQVVSVPVVKFHYKGEDAKEKIGLIAEEAPNEILAEGNNKAISLNEYISLLHAALKAQQQELEALKAELKEVNAQSSELTDVLQTMLAKQNDSESGNRKRAIDW